jgi:enoyl-CoA hydratase
MQGCGLMIDNPQNQDASGPNDFIQTRIEGRTGRVIINRPQALNALNMEMCAQINEILLTWCGSASIDRVLITASEGRAFCAGGDVRSIVPLVKKDPLLADAYFKAEYILDCLINAFPKPVITIADGLTMGGGCGVLLNAAYPVITEKMDFSMPETAIGFFPDVGASVFLRRPPHHIGVMMGMTGWRIGAGDMIAMGSVRHAVNADDVEVLIDQLVALNDNDGIDDVLSQFNMADQPKPLMDESSWISSHFSKATPQDIRDSLEGDEHPMAERIRLALDTRSPYSIAITHRLLTEGALNPKNIPDALRLDYVLACRIARYPDFTEGVRAVLIDKDNAPVWQHSRLDAVEEDLINVVFAMENKPDLGYPEQQLTS